MNSLPGIARAKLIVSEYGPVLAIVLAVVGVIALGGAAWIYTHPPTTTVTDQTNKQTVRSTLQTSAVVTGDSSLYQRGDRLENQPVYFVAATPNPALTVRTTVPDEQAVQVTQQITLVVRATYDGDSFWQETRTLERKDATTSNGTVTTSTELDVPRLKDRITPVQNEIGSAGSLMVFINVTTSYETDQYSGTLSRTTPIELSDRTYAIEQLSFEETKSTPKTREVVLPTRNASSYVIPAGIGVISLLCAGAVVSLYSRREQWSTIEDQIHQNRYAEWISVGTLSPDIGTQKVPLESLEDLVDVGIDMGKRVIHDRERDVYAVIDGQIVYYYGEESAWAGTPADSTQVGDPDTSSSFEFEAPGGNDRK